MKQILFLFFVCSIGKLQAQFNESTGTLKIMTGYTHDFPELNGYTFGGEYTFPLSSQFEGGIGAKHADLAGYPRTAQVQEYTRATTLDFNFYWSPLRSETSIFRIGVGYAFSFYNIKRAYPVITGTGDAKATSWHPQAEKGRTSGPSLIAEYEYAIPNSAISIGLRGAIYKAYDRTYFIGPVVGYRL